MQYSITHKNINSTAYSETDGDDRQTDRQSSRHKGKLRTILNLSTRLVKMARQGRRFHKLY